MIRSGLPLAVFQQYCTIVISIGFISWFVFHLERLHEKIIEKMRGHSHGKFRLIFSYCIVMEGGRGASLFNRCEIFRSNKRNMNYVQFLSFWMLLKLNRILYCLFAVLNSSRTIGNMSFYEYFIRKDLHCS